ncbi:hypothetical protein KAR26_03085 [Candidatus Parcubacteria bacterium]|nr:hypothetical protein [Candidatus Parcubacteria bacterium]
MEKLEEIEDMENLEDVVAKILNAPNDLAACTVINLKRELLGTNKFLLIKKLLMLEKTGKIKQKLYITGSFIDIITRNPRKKDVSFFEKMILWDDIVMSADTMRTRNDLLEAIKEVGNYSSIAAVRTYRKKVKDIIYSEGGINFYHLDKRRTSEVIEHLEKQPQGCSFFIKQKAA